MKTTKSIFTMFAMAALAAICGFPQGPESPTKNPFYDAPLAQKLGADKSGMRSFVLAILKTGPKDGDIKGKEREEMFKGHFTNINSLAKQGKLAVAGPFNDPERKYRGLYIFSVGSIEEARKLLEVDPTVKSGIFIAEYVPWYGSAAMMEVNRIHNTITIDNP